MTSLSAMITSRSKPLRKILPLRLKLPTVLLKSPSICQNLKKILKTLQRRSWLKLVIIQPAELCFENEGYQGRLDHPARANHRIIRFDMDGHDWGFQYSPYAYFNEHCIFLDSQHVPMAISRKTFERLLTIVETFPGYFAGSNADLPIVGGSILTHDHYQGGRHTFPMELAPVRKALPLRDLRLYR